MHKEKSGATIVNGQTYLDVTVDRTNVFDCNKSEQLKVQCTADITVYSAQFDLREGEAFNQCFQNDFNKTPNRWPGCKKSVLRFARWVIV